MLQKYHPNPLSHFLALHNSQATATHNHVVDAHTLATTIANGHHTQFQLQHHYQQQQQQQQQHQPSTALLANHHPQSPHNHTSIQLAAAAAQHLNSQNSPTHHPHNQHHHPHNHQQHHNRSVHHNHHTQQLIEAAAAGNTTLDAGKSFTIAAILGLQKSAMENTRKEYTNNVINLSLNGGNNNLPPTIICSDDEEQQQQQHHNHHQHHQHRDSLNNNNNNNRDVANLNSNKSSNICNSFISSNNTTTSNNSANSFNCDNTNVTTAAAAASVLMNRYLPSAMVNVSGSNVATTPSIASFASSPVMAHQQHARANSFVAAAAAAAAAAANGAPSALQSLQQLHQQHAHQTNLSFQREKLKSEHNAKKSSLKNKRVRTIFTPEQLERLEAEFERQQYMVGPERLYLAHTLQLTEAQVKVWFQNRRIKWRKHHLEMTQQRLALLRQTQIPATANGTTSEQATINIDDNNDDDEECDDIKREQLRELNNSRQDTESELSICNDSMDAESIIEGDDET